MVFLYDFMKGTRAKCFGVRRVFTKRERSFTPVFFLLECIMYSQKAAF
jgi:hypothetical protein